VSGDRDSGACLVKFSWTAIRRHAPARGPASPDDPALAGFRAQRRKKVRPRRNARAACLSRVRGPTRTHGSEGAGHGNASLLPDCGSQVRL
jgi:hypothetical protein